MTSATHPLAGPQYSYTYDVNGRLSGMTGTGDAFTGPAAAGASYGPAGEMTYLGYDGYKPDANVQQQVAVDADDHSPAALSALSQTTVMDMQYNYTAGQTKRQDYVIERRNHPGKTSLMHTTL